MFNPPGAPPMPIADLAGMMAGTKTAFPKWVSKCFGVSKNEDGTYTVLTQQVIGPMEADFPAMGPFPAVALASVPEVMKMNLAFPVEVGTYRIADGKIANGTYAGLTKDVPEAGVTPEVSAIWNKKGDLSDVGFGAVFTLMGVTLPPPPPPKLDLVMTAECASFDDWLPCFNEHAESTSFTYKGKTHSVSMARGACTDVTKEDVLCDIKDKNKVCLVFQAVDMAKMGAMMSEPAFTEGIKDAVVSQDPPNLATDMPTPDGPPPEGGKVDMFFSYEVADVDKWIEGFLAHGTSKTGTWGVETKYTRAEFCDEARTRVFKSVKHPRRVGGLIYGVDMGKMGEFMGDPSFAKVSEVLGVNPESMFMKQIAVMPPPPA